MKYLFLLVIIGSSSVQCVQLNHDKVYPIISEICTFRGCSYTGSNTLDLSCMELNSIVGITKLLVEYNNELLYLSEISRLRILLNDNCLETIPKEILELNILSMDVTNNNDLEVPDWLIENHNFYFYRTIVLGFQSYSKKRRSL